MTGIQLGLNFFGKVFCQHCDRRSASILFLTKICLILFTFFTLSGAVCLVFLTSAFFIILCSLEFLAPVLQAICYKHQWYSYSAISSVCYGISDMSHGHNSTVFRVLFPKISTGQKKIAPTGRHGRHVFATLLVILNNDLNGKIAVAIPQSKSAIPHNKPPRRLTICRLDNNCCHKHCCHSL